MKFPIKWHEDSLFKMKRTLSGYTQQLAAYRAIVDRLYQETIIYQYQIDRAKQENKKDFDREKFNKKRS